MSGVAGRLRGIGEKEIESELSDGCAEGDGCAWMAKRLEFKEPMASEDEGEEGCPVNATCGKVHSGESGINLLKSSI